MKTSLLFIGALWLINNTLHAQIQSSYGTLTNEQSFSLTPTSDFHYLLSGVTDSALLGKQEASLTKITPNGTVAWSHVYSGKQSEAFNSVREVPNIGVAIKYVTVGQTNSYGMGANDVFLMGVNAVGTPLFSRTFGGPKTDRGNCIQVVKDVQIGGYGYVIAGETTSHSSVFGGYNMYVIKTDLMGNLVASVVIGNWGDEKANWIEQTSDGGYIVVGYSTTPPSCVSTISPVNQNILVVRLNPDLSIKWSRVYGDGPNLLKNDVAYCVKESRLTNSYVVCGFTESRGYGAKDIFLLSVDTAGTLQWMKTYGRKQNDVGLSLVVNNNTTAVGEIVVTGATQSFNTAGNSDAFILKTDIGGNLIWMRKYGSKSGDTFEEIALKPGFNAGYAFAGHTKGFGAGGLDHLFALSDFSGNIDQLCDVYVIPKIISHQPCEDKIVKAMRVDGQRVIQHPYTQIAYKRSRCSVISTREGDDEQADWTDTQEEAVNTILQVSPSPASSEITISFPSELEGSLVQIRNINGELVHEGTAVAGSMSVSVQHLPDGLYLVTAIDQEGRNTSTRFVKK
jgi:hypothetical protein